MTGGGAGRGYYYEREIGGSLTAGFPFSQIERSQSIEVNWDLFAFSVHENATGDATVAPFAGEVSVMVPVGQFVAAVENLNSAEC